MAQIVSKHSFMRAKIQQQIELWRNHKLSTPQLVDYVLGYGTDADVEWLCEHFDPMDTITKY